MWSLPSRLFQVRWHSIQPAPRQTGRSCWEAERDKKNMHKIVYEIFILKNASPSHQPPLWSKTLLWIYRYLAAVLWIRIRIRIRMFLRPSESVSHKYGFGSGSFHHQFKPWFRLFVTFLWLRYLCSGSASGSGSVGPECFWTSRIWIRIR
jgi:hypothetical protein